MENPSPKLHIFFFPLMIQGHTIPVINMAKLFASRGLKSTVVAAPLAVQLHSETIRSSRDQGLDIELLLVDFPEISEEAEPREAEKKFSEATAALDQQLARLLEERRPDCLVADAFFSWATDVAAKFGIPRVVFHGTGFFPLCAILSVLQHEPHEKVESDSEPFVVPNLPDDIALTRNKLPPYVKRNAASSPFAKSYREGRESELRCFGVIVNSFYELEPRYADHYRSVLGRKAWHIGPVSLCERTDRADEHECLKWLDSKKPDSVVYLCFGSMARFTDPQLVKIAMGLENSGREFIWVVRKEKKEKEREEWLPEGFEERVKGKGLIIRGWAPQVAILKHKAVGGFVTHCGWNSTLEAVSAGVPVVAWPMFSEQFYNEKLATEILKIGVGVGAVKWALVAEGSVESEAMEKAVRRITEGEEAEEMRGRAKKLAEMARKAVEEGGSSYADLSAFIEELRRHRTET